VVDHFEDTQTVAEQHDPPESKPLGKAHPAGHVARGLVEALPAATPDLEVASPGPQRRAEVVAAVLAGDEHDARLSPGAPAPERGYAVERAGQTVDPDHDRRAGCRLGGANHRS